MKLTPNERNLLFVVACALVFLLYWYFIFDPVLVKIGRLQVANQGLALQLKRSINTPPGQQANINVTKKEEQVSMIVNFIDQKFRYYNINLVSIDQVSEKNKITIDLKFSSTYYQLLGFLNSIHELGTLIVFDNVVVSQQGGHLNISMRILSGYL